MYTAVSTNTTVANLITIQAIEPNATTLLCFQRICEVSRTKNCAHKAKVERGCLQIVKSSDGSSVARRLFESLSATASRRIFRIIKMVFSQYFKPRRKATAPSVRRHSGLVRKASSQPLFGPLTTTFFHPHAPSGYIIDRHKSDPAAISIECRSTGHRVYLDVANIDFILDIALCPTLYTQFSILAVSKPQRESGISSGSCTPDAAPPVDAEVYFLKFRIIGLAEVILVKRIKISSNKNQLFKMIPTSVEINTVAHAARVDAETLMDQEIINRHCASHNPNEYILGGKNIWVLDIAPKHPRLYLVYRVVDEKDLAFSAVDINPRHTHILAAVASGVHLMYIFDLRSFPLVPLAGIPILDTYESTEFHNKVVWNSENPNELGLSPIISGATALKTNLYTVTFPVLDFPDPSWSSAKCAPFEFCLLDFCPWTPLRHATTSMRGIADVARIQAWSTMLTSRCEVKVRTLTPKPGYKFAEIQDHPTSSKQIDARKVLEELWQSCPGPIDSSVTEKICSCVGFLDSSLVRDKKQGDDDVSKKIEGYDFLLAAYPGCGCGLDDDSDWKYKLEDLRILGPQSCVLGYSLPIVNDYKRATYEVAEILKNPEIAKTRKNKLILDKSVACNRLESVCAVYRNIKTGAEPRPLEQTTAEKSRIGIHMNPALMKTLQEVWVTDSLTETDTTEMQLEESMPLSLGLEENDLEMDLMNEPRPRDETDLRPRWVYKSSIQSTEKRTGLIVQQKETSGFQEDEIDNPE